MRDEIANLEEQKRNCFASGLTAATSFLNRFRAPADPADLKASLNDIELRLNSSSFNPGV